MTGYDVQHKLKSASAWPGDDVVLSVTVTTAQISGLAGGSEYEVRVRAVNAEGDGVWSGAVSGTALDNRPPVLPDGPVGRQVAENLGAGANVGGPVTAVDPDSGDSVSYELAATGDHASFAINRGSGQITARSDLDYEVKGSYQVTVIATDDDGLFDTVTVNIGVVDVNDPPEFASESVRLTVEENAGDDAVVGAAVAATDDDGDSLTYSLPSLLLVITPVSLSTVRGRSPLRSDLDHEAKSSYEFTVTVTDDGTGSLSDTVEVTVTVVDKDEPPAAPARFR